MRSAFVLVSSVLLAGLGALPAQAQWSNYGYNGNTYGNVVRCESRDGRMTRCGTSGGDAQLVRQLSDSACIRGRTWGTDYQGLWVSGGCRAEFDVSGYDDDDNRYGSGYYGNDDGYGNTYASDGLFRCESRDSRTTRCNSYGNARFVRQLSNTACVRGRTWGSDSRGVWVSGGCRALFQSGYGNYGNGGYYGDGGYGSNDMVRCESRDNHSRTCNLGSSRRGGIRLLRQLSDTPCIEGRTWGRSGNGVWVTGGCRGEFVVERNGRGNGGWQPPPPPGPPPGVFVNPAPQSRSLPPGVGIGQPGQVAQEERRSERPAVDEAPQREIERPGREQPAPRMPIRVAQPAQPVEVARTEPPGGAAAQAPRQVESAPAEAPRDHPRLRQRQEDAAGQPGQVTP